MSYETEARFRTMSENLAIRDVNSRLMIASVVVVLWLAVRKHILGDPSGLSVLLEWLGLIALTVGLYFLRRQGPIRMAVPIALALTALIMRSIIDTQGSSAPAQTYPEYWWGFGGHVLVAALVFALVSVGALDFRGQLDSPSSTRLQNIIRYLKTIISLGAIGWTLPSIVQPMDAWLNLGDSTEKVLDELTGWTVGNIPAVHTSWSHNSLLGFPLLPLSFVEGFGAAKVIIVVLYANALVMIIPKLMGTVISRVVPQIGMLPAFAFSLIVVSISGSPGNSSLFQELSFLARGFMPIALGSLAVCMFGRDMQASRWQVAIFGVLAGLALMNNYEYGFGAVVAALVIVVVSSPTVPLAIRSTRMFLIGSILVVVAVTIPALMQGGNWVNRRLGTWADVIAGDARVGSNNAGSWPPAFGLPALCFVLGVVGASVGLRGLRSVRENRLSRSAAVSSLYFGVWVVASAPYFLNGGTAGAFRTQFLFIPVALLAFSLFGVACTPILKERRDHVWSRAKSSESLARVPIVLLCSLVLAAVVQVPNGLKEWQRVQTPNLKGKTEDEWSPQRLDWIRTEKVIELANEFGGPKEVGWWYIYGNAMEAVTGIENLLGTTAFEGIRTIRQRSLGCEPLMKTQKAYVISLEGIADRIQSCGLQSVRAVTSANEDGLVVYQIDRG